MMVWAPSLTIKPCPLVIIPPLHQTIIDFVEIVYELVLRSYLDVHLKVDDLILMEDGALVHLNKASKVRKDKWPCRN